MSKELRTLAKIMTAVSALSVIGAALNPKGRKALLSLAGTSLATAAMCVRIGA